MVCPQAKIEGAGILEDRLLVDRIAEPHGLVGARVAGVVENLLDPHPVDAPAQAHQRHREEVVGEAGIDPGGEAAGTSLTARLIERRDHLRRARLGIDQGRHRGVHDVLARGERTAQVLDVLGRILSRGAEVGDCVRVRGESGLDVGGRAQADRLLLDELAHVDVVLLRAVGDHADQLVARVVQQLPDHHLPDEARSPEDHLVRHEKLSWCRGADAVSASSLRRSPSGSVP